MSATALLFFFNDTATTEIYTLSLHDALPIFIVVVRDQHGRRAGEPEDFLHLLPHLAPHVGVDRKSTRLNSSHSQISYAVFCLKKKNEVVRLLQPHVPPRPLHRSKPGLLASHQ